MVNALIDQLAKLFGSKPEDMLGLPPLSGGFEDYGPWGAGGTTAAPGFTAPAASTGGMYPNAPGTDAGMFPGAPGTPNPFGEAAGAPAMAAPSGPEFNALFDPSRGGLYSTLGAAMGYPTRAEHQQQQQGAARTGGLQKLGAMVQSGIPAQKAILDFINTPEGAAFIANSNDPSGEIKQFLGLAIPEPDPTAARADAFGATGGVAGGDIATDLAPGQSQAHYLEVAEKLLLAKDDEGAKIAMTMAEEARLAGTAAAEPLNADWIKQYRFYRNEEEAAGRMPDSFDNWKIKHTKAGVQTADGVPIHPKFVEEAIRLSTAADLAEQSYAEAVQFRQLSIGANTGWMQSMTLPFQQALKSIGINVNMELPEAELINALSKQMALRLRNPESGFGLTGNTSNFDLQFLTAATAGLDKTPEANQGALLVLGSRMRRQALLDAAKADFIQETGGLKGWNELRKELSETTPLLNDEEKEFLNVLRETNGLKRVLGLDAKGMPIYGPPVAAPARPRSPTASGPGASAPAPNAVLPPMPDDFGVGKPDAIRQRAWEIMNEDKAGGVK